MTEAADLTLATAFVAGVFSFLTPCVLPLIPSYLSYITGMSFADLNSEHQSARVRITIFLHSLVFVLGFSIIFISLGILAGAASTTIREGIVWLQKIGGVIIFLFGVHVSGLFRFHMLLGEKRMHLHKKPHGYLGTLLVGIAFAAGWTPCIGPILGSILMLAATEADGVRHAFWLLTAYSVGLGIPFVVAGVLFHSFLTAFNHVRKYIRVFEMVTGALLMLVGVLLFFDQFSRLTGLMYQIFPANFGG